MSEGLNIQFVQDYYQRLTDTELLRIAKKDLNDLTSEAQRILEEELFTRNLQLNSYGDLNSQTLIEQVETKNVKSFEFAFLFAFLFGPFGVLYVSTTYGIILIVLGVIGFGLLNYIGLAIVWVLSIVVAFQATSNSKSSNNLPIRPSIDRESLLNQLTQLYSLRENKVITEVIYEQERQKVLRALETTQ